MDQNGNNKIQKRVVISVFEIATLFSRNGELQL